MEAPFRTRSHCLLVEPFSVLWLCINRSPVPDLSNPKSRPGDRASGVPLILICFLLRDSVKASTSNTTRSPLLQERPNQCNSEEDPHGPFVLFSARLSRFHGLRLCDLPSQ